MALDVSAFCESFYASHYLPVAHYRGDALANEHPSRKTSPKQDYLYQSLMATGRNPDMCFDESIAIYGIVKEICTEDVVLLGPVFTPSVSPEAIRNYMRRHSTHSDVGEDVLDLIQDMPKLSLNRFLNLLAFIHLAVNQESISIISHFRYVDEVLKNKIDAEKSKQVVDSKEEGVLHNTYMFEKRLLDFVRRGEPEKLSAFLSETLKSNPLHEGKLANEPLRQAKNLLVGLVTMVGKIGAIEGGMDVEEAYQLIDSYIQESERTQSIEKIWIIQFNLLIDFAAHVAKSKVPANMTSEIFACVQFINNHTNEQICVADVAAFAGKSRAYISRKFMEETGTGIGEYITKSKCIEAASLLRYTEMTIGEISAYLYFSSQSYFQNVFRKEFSTTPQRYRRSSHLQ
jgi:AraC-like DNA-binding protein